MLCEACAQLLYLFSNEEKDSVTISYPKEDLSITKSIDSGCNLCRLFLGWIKRVLFPTTDSQIEALWIRRSNAVALKWARANSQEHTSWQENLELHHLEGKHRAVSLIDLFVIALL